MQAGFAVLSAGSIRSVNVKNILLKNLLDACMGAITWYLIGYGFAYGGTSPFIGTSGATFALSGVDDASDAAYGANAGMDWAMWQFQFAFAAAAATIVSGAVAERCQLGAYLVYTMVITGFIYPVVVHWVWDSAGFLSTTNPDSWLVGCIDFAGSGVVHMTGGFAAIVAAKILGPRMGRWDNPAAFEGHSTPLQVTGTFLLWFGWYGFNPGSTLVLHGSANTAARATVCTTLSGAAAGVTGLFIKALLPSRFGGTHVYDVGHTCNSLLGGLVAITAGCATVKPWAAIIIGFLAAWIYHGASCMMRQLKIDDPLDAFAVHGSCGFWGVINVGIFTAKEYSFSNGARSPDAGIFMPGTRGELFATQIIAVLMEVTWVVGTSIVLFGALQYAGIFRVPASQEEMGLDKYKHGGKAYLVRATSTGIEITQPDALGEQPPLRMPSTSTLRIVQVDSETPSTRAAPHDVAVEVEGQVMQTPALADELPQQTSAPAEAQSANASRSNDQIAS